MVLIFINNVVHKSYSKNQRGWEKCFYAKKPEDVRAYG